MTEQQIDRDRLRAGAEHAVEMYGPAAWPDMPSADLLALLDQLEQAEARIKAVRDVHTGTAWPGVADKTICDACDQMWPCATIRALD